MQGCGNDYIFLDCRDQVADDPGGLSCRMSDRHFGIGSDGLVLMLPSQTADLRMRIFNADGSEAGMCGNAARCVARYAWDCGWVTREPLRLATNAGVRELRHRGDGNISILMGSPDSRNQPTVRYRGRELLCLSMGNPHAVLPVRAVQGFPLREAAKEIRAQADVNVEIVQVTARNRLTVRVFERGSGEALACGTGACAAAVAAVLRGSCDRDTDILVQMPGGALTVRWLPDGTLLLTGGARQVFCGEWDDSPLAEHITK